jgi:hypothetical protein
LDALAEGKKRREAKESTVDRIIHSTTWRGNAPGKIHATRATTIALMPIMTATKAVGTNASSKHRTDPASNQSSDGFGIATFDIGINNGKVKN